MYIYLNFMEELVIWSRREQNRSRTFSWGDTWPVDGNEFVFPEFFCLWEILSCEEFLYLKWALSKEVMQQTSYIFFNYVEILLLYTRFSQMFQEVMKHFFFIWCVANYMEFVELVTEATVPERKVKFSDQLYLTLKYCCKKLQVLFYIDLGVFLKERNLTW